jgi:hypothetical protein
VVGDGKPRGATHVLNHKRRQCPDCTPRDSSLKPAHGRPATENTEGTERFVVADAKPRRATHVLNQNRHQCPDCTARR